jgi:uncharacterized protein
MSAVFLDTAYLLAVLVENDALHERAVAWRGALWGRFVTTEYVLLEVLDALSIPPWRPVAVEALRMLREDPTVTIVPADTRLFDEGIELYRARSDKSWGLTDCISFIVMAREGLTEALTSDRDYEQAGFRALLRHEPPVGS